MAEPDIKPDIGKLDYASEAPRVAPGRRFSGALTLLIGANAFGGFALIAVGLFYLPDGPFYGALFLTGGILLCMGTLGALGRDPPRVLTACMLAVGSAVCLMFAGFVAHARLADEEANLVGESYRELAGRSPKEASFTVAAAYDFAQVLAFATAACAVLLVASLLLRVVRRPIASLPFDE